MKRWALFLGLLAVGLLILLWIDRGLRRPPKEAPPAPTPPAVTDTMTQVDLGDGKQVSVGSAGPLSDTKFDERGAPVYRITTRDSTSLGDGVYRFDDLVARFFVKGTDRVKLEVRARSARGRMRTTPTPEFDREFPVELEDVVATLHEGSPFAPLVLRVPRAVGVFAEESFRSDERVEIQGTGLGADGVGVSFRGKERVLELAQDTHANMTLEDGTIAKLAAAGGLTFTALEKLGEGATRVVAKDRAHLTFEGGNPLVVDADRVELDAQVSQEKKSVRPTEIRAAGKVELAPKDGRFFGDEARLALLENGRPRSASLTGAPRVTLTLHGVDTSSVPGAQGAKDADLDVALSGAGPLEVVLEGDAHFDFQGPATLTVPSLDLSLVAQDKLSGTRLGESELGRVDAFGNVAVDVRGSQAHLTAPALAIERRAGADGKPAAALTTFGPTHAAGALPNGDTFDLAAANGLEFVRGASSFQVPVARDVDLTITGKRGFRARANEVRDLDEATQSFTGIGAVTFEGELGRGRAERVIVKSRDSAELIGAPTSPAHLEFEQGRLDARRITIEGEVLRAEGEASAHVELEGATYDLAGRWISVERLQAAKPERLELSAGGDVAAHVKESDRELDLHAQSLEARASATEERPRTLVSEGFTAAGDVSFHVEAAAAAPKPGVPGVPGVAERQTFDGAGERLTIEADNSGTLVAKTGERVKLAGRLPENRITFDLSAVEVGFSPEKLSADGPVIEIVGVDVPLGQAGAPASETPLRAVAGAMTIDKTSILFTEGVYLGQAASPETSWSLDAEKIVLHGAELPADAETLEGEPRFTVANLLAWEGFQAEFARGLRARGSSLMLDREHLSLSLRGDPAQLDVEADTFEHDGESPRKSGIAGHRVSTDWIEFDLATGFLRASNGSWTPLDPSAGDYEVTFAAMEPAFGLDSRVQVVRELVFHDRARDFKVRSSWALFWLDEARIQDLARRMMPRAELVPIVPLPVTPESDEGHAPPKNRFLQQLLEFGFSDWVREAYFEGNLEIVRKGNRRLRADAMYVDLIDGHGWVQNLDLVAELPLRAMANRLKLHVDWMRVAPDGSGRAERARLTTCEFDEPHYEVTLEDIRFKPRPTEKARKAKAAGRKEGADDTDGSYDLRAKHNRLDLGIWPRIPLPSFPLVMDAKGQVDPESLRILGLGALTFGSSARFGTFVGLSFAVPIGFVSQGLSRVLGKGGEKIKDDNAGFVRYLNSRGLLLGVKNEVEQAGVFKMTTWVHFINDTGRDRGLVRVPKDDREDLRAWLRTEGRRWIGDGEWFDFRLTKQTDPGVQAEFFEGDYLRWEERETYIHWRKARGLDYTRATAEVQLDDYRTEVMEQPSAGYTRGRAGVTRWWGRDLVYSSDTTAAYLKRIEGDVLYEAPFLDGFGEREVVRLDTRHRWELPLPLGALDARLVPFLEARGTAWDRGVGSSQAPTRGALLAGAEAATTFWRMFDDEDLHTLTPSIGVRGDIAVEEDGATPAQFDAVEDPLDGRFVEAGLRSRWVRPRRAGEVALNEDRFLDIEVRQPYGFDLPNGRPDGWQPLRVSAQWVSALADVPFGVMHDARYDVDHGDSDYSHTQFGFRPVPAIELQTGYDIARDLAGDRLYSAWTLGALYNFSDKWQIEARQTVSSSSGSQLNSGVLLRRIGHDFLFEIEYSLTAGEGGGTVSFTLTPLLAYRERRFGWLARWMSEGN